MNTAETLIVSAEATGAFLALLAVAREAVKRPWIKASWSFSIAILPADKRDPAPKAATTIPAGETGGTGASPVSPAAQGPAVRPAA